MPMSLNYLELLVGYFIYVLTPYMSEIVLYILQKFGIYRYVMYGDKDNYKKIIRLIEKQTKSTSLSYRNGKIQPAGYFYGPRCFGLYSQESRYADDERVVIITTTEYYNSLIKAVETGSPVDSATATASSTTSTAKALTVYSKPAKQQMDTDPLIIEDKPVKETINVFIRSGTYKNFFYKKLSKDVTHINPFKTQEPIVEDIIRQYKKNERLAVFIHGVSMAGKSTIGYLVAKALKADYTHSFNPSDPGDTFDNMIGDVNHGEDNGAEDDKPLVIVLEEADIVIDNIHKQLIKRHNDIPTPVHNKTTWNNFLNDLIFYNKIIVILTSNSSKEEIDNLDSSYLNQGRIDKTYSMMEPLA